MTPVCLAPRQLEYKLTVWHGGNVWRRDTKYIFKKGAQMVCVPSSYKMLAPKLLYKAQIFPTFSLRLFITEGGILVLCDQLETSDSSKTCYTTVSPNAGSVSWHKLEEPADLSSRRRTNLLPHINKMSVFYLIIW